MKKSIGVLAVVAAVVLSARSVWADAGWVVRAYGDSAQRWYFAAAIADDGTFEYAPREP